MVSRPEARLVALHRFNGLLTRELRMLDARATDTLNSAPCRGAANNTFFESANWTIFTAAIYLLQTRTAGGDALDRRMFGFRDVRRRTI